MKKKILGACVGDCVHVAGVLRFLNLAKKEGYETLFLGPAVSNEELTAAIREHQPDVVGVSYRLTPEAGIDVLKDLKTKVAVEGLGARKFVLGGLPGLIEKEKKDGFFDACFRGDETEEVMRYLRGESLVEEEGRVPPQNIVERVAYKEPFPVLRHHFGLPSLDDTVNGVAKIAESGCLDVISLGTDQNCQAHLFSPERMSKEDGAGGVPVRGKQDLGKLFAASRVGNFPLMRTYAGTSDMAKHAKLYFETINNAWAAISLFWFNEMDGRGPMSLDESLKAHVEAIKWHSRKGIPVEVLESHHWSMRDAPDEVAIAAGYLGALICKELGVKNFISQYMFNTPVQTTFRDDLAKMLAQKELIDELQDHDFRVYTQTRTGLFSYPSDLGRAKGQLAGSTMLQMQLNPDIVHVVSFSEANHAATAEDVIESCNIASQVIGRCIEGQPRMRFDPYVVAKKDQLKAGALKIIDAYSEIAGQDYANPEALHAAVSNGIFWAPQLNSYWQKKQATAGK